jgi:hypothetical protein
VGDTPQLFPILFGLTAFRVVRAEFQTARELGEQLLRLAQSVQDPALLVPASHALGQTLYFLGELVAAREYLEHGIAVYDPQQHRSLAALYGTDPGAYCLCFAADDRLRGNSTSGLSTRGTRCTLRCEGHGVIYDYFTY